MDYSSIHNDPTDASPWASSPAHGRTSFDRVPSEGPPSPSTALVGSSFPETTREDVSDRNYGSESFPQGAGAIENGRLESAGLPYRPNQESSTLERPHSRDAVVPQLQHQQPKGPGPDKTQNQRQHSSKQASRPAPTYTLQAKVNGMERSGRNSRDPMLRFDIYTNLPGYRTTQFRDVRRSHMEFQRLADHLISANPEALVPALPFPSTPAGVGTDEDETKLKYYMQRWLNYVCSSEVLMRDEEMIRFVEGDPGYSPIIRRSQPATGVRRKVIKQFAPPPDDTPELQEARPVVKLFYLGAMDAGQKVDKVVKTRRSLGLAEADLGQRLAAMSEQENHPGLKNAYRKLGRTIQTAGDLHAAQGTAEATTFGDPLSYHSSDAFIVKETLTNRHILIRELLQAQQATRSKLSATDRLKASTSVRRDKVDEAISALDEARTHESYLHHKVQRVTSNLVDENRRWFTRTAADLRAALREYVIREIESERRSLSMLEAVRPDIRAIDSSGGLSRLGREATPAARRATLMSSQGPKGDAWSGVQRRTGDGLNRSIAGGYATPSASTSEQGPLGGEEEDDDVNGAGGRERSASGAGSVQSGKDDDDDDRVDARNAASRLAASTF